MPAVISIQRAILLVLIVLAALPVGASTGTRAAVAFHAVPGAQPDLVLRGEAPRVAPLAATRRLSFALALAPRDATGMDALLHAVYDRRSPLFHHYLTPAAFEARFGPDPAAVRALSAWLRAQGLSPAPWHGGLLLPVSGTVARVEAAFHAGLSRYRFADGERFAPDSSPLLPTSLASSVTTIIGLSQISPRRSPARGLLSATPAPVQGGGAASAGIAARRTGSGPGGGYAPSEVTSAYDFRPLYAKGYHGEHMRVALVELAPYELSDVETYAAAYHIALPAINDISVPPGNEGEQPQVEATLDIEQLLAAVPGATIDVYEAPNDNTGVGQVEAYTQVARAGNADVLSLEWVNCEPGAADSPGFISTQHEVFKQLALQGTTVVSATGDEGAYSCGDQVQQYDREPAVNLPASDPYVLAVGASDLTLATTGNGTATIAAETAWSCPAHVSTSCARYGPMGAGSGGGVSQIFHTGDQFGTDLSWQTGPGVLNSHSTGGREVPDVVLSGAFGTTLAHEYSIYYQGGWKVGGGTSAAAPLWAALIVLADQYLKDQGLPRLGWVNGLVYQLGAVVPTYPAYHDITSGNNLLYSAGPGWDYATGWGSPDAWNFVRDAAAFEHTAQQPATATAGATSSSIPIFAPSATGTATSSPTVAPPPTRAATVAFPSLTPIPRPSATRTPSPRATPRCSGGGITNGAFSSGTLACWTASGTPPPRVGPSPHFKHRYSVQLASGKPGVAGSMLSQTFSVPAGSAHDRLHLDFWLSRSVVTARVPPVSAARCGKACPSAVPPVPPLLLVRDQAGRVLSRVSIVPHRDRAWSGLVVALPAHVPRLSLSIQVPPQPAGVTEVLIIDDVHLGP